MLQPTKNPQSSPSHAVAIGAGSLKRLPELLDERNARRLFLILDRAACDQSGAGAVLDEVTHGRETVFFTGFEPNPKLEDVDRGRRFCEQFTPDVVIAIGGGTAIDIAKLVSAFASESASSRDLSTGAAPLTAGASVPLIVVPTTAGTGSEATHFAVVYVDGVKHSVAAPMLLPNVALVDSTLTRSLPDSITAATGLDAFCQAVESLWAVGSTAASVRDAAQALRLIHASLPTAIHDPTPEAREAMMHGAHLAGRAINVGKTTLPHALSYSITSRYGIPHGRAVAMTLSSVLRFNAGVTEADCLDPRGGAHVRHHLELVAELLGVASIDAAGDAIDRFIRDCGASPGPFPEPVTTAIEWREIVERVNPERLANNPRRATFESLMSFYSA